jgi:hypothetical protein
MTSAPSGFTASPLYGMDALEAAISTPPQCSNASYREINDVTREVIQGFNSYCDNDLDGGWYRFTDVAFKYLAGRKYEARHKCNLIYEVDAPQTPRLW